MLADGRSQPKLTHSHRMWPFILMIALHSSYTQCSFHHVEVSSLEWDVLIFTQHWPVTVCQEWKNANESHTCSMPTPADSWTIHGLWPSKLGTIGPQFCNRTWNFDVEQIRSIEAPLNQLWLNIEKDTPTYSLWSHEWSKHGTCAASLPALGSELQYFSQGLKLRHQYNLVFALAGGGIFPNAEKEYQLTQIYRTLKKFLGVEPIIECRNEHGYSYLFELRLCFSKKLELINCTGVKLAKTVKVEDEEIQTNCPADRGILYPPSLASFKRSWHNKHLVQLYRLVSWMQWFTL